MLSLIVITVLIFALILLWSREFAYVGVQASTNVSLTVTGRKLHSRIENLNDNTNIFALFEEEGRYWLYSEDLQESVELLDLYPSFRGKVEGIVAVDASYVGKPSQFNNTVFFLWSSDGKVYNPITISHDYRENALFLPLDMTLIGVEGILTTGMTQSFPKLRFRYTTSKGIVYEEALCSFQSMEGIVGRNERVCPNTESLISIPTFPFLSISKGKFLTGTDGWIYEGPSWTKYLNWKEWYAQVPSPIPPSYPKTEGSIILGADFHNEYPIFLLEEGGILYLVDAESRKYNFRKMFRQVDVLPVGGIIDIASVGINEYDYLVAATDGYLYSPILPQQRLKIQDLTSISSRLISISGIRKYIADELCFFVVFFFENGQWIERALTLETGTIGPYGDSGTNWKAWIGEPIEGDRYFLSSYNWTVFVLNDNEPSRSYVYSRNDPRYVLYDILKCASDEEGNRITPYCVGKRRMVQTTIPPNTVHEPSTSTSRTPLFTFTKISRAECLAKLNNNAVVYNNNTCDCSVYEYVRQEEAVYDPTAELYYDESLSFLYKNVFCMKGTNNKYLYWDFKNSTLALKDVCVFEGPLEAENDAEHLKTLGSMWRLGTYTDNQTEYLENINSGSGGFMNTNLKLQMKFKDGDEALFFRYDIPSKQFRNGTKCLDPSLTLKTCDSTTTWNLHRVPCPSYLEEEPGDLENMYGYIKSFCS